MVGVGGDQAAVPEDVAADFGDGFVEDQDVGAGSEDQNFVFAIFFCDNDDVGDDGGHNSSA